MVLSLVLGFSYSYDGEEWGFYGHRKINRMAVFTLPPPLVGFFKQHIDYVAEHSVDPDKRRHATKFEAVRHYIDIDHWGTYPYDNVPREYSKAILAFGKVVITDGKGRDGLYTVTEKEDSMHWKSRRNSFSVPTDSFISYFRKEVMPSRYEDVWSVSVEGHPYWQSGTKKIEIRDSFTSYGILPFALERIHYQLVRAFESKDGNRILRYASDYGHYIGDAHVPLHTTENYNGQMTNQVGIHAFWESRIPELFAEKEWDFFVGKAKYVRNLSDYYWDIILDSHVYLDSVLLVEKRLSKTFPEDKQYCYDERLERTIRIQCPEYAEAFMNEMGTMVEDRMRASIKAIGSLWYSAWIHAGKPDLTEVFFDERMEQKKDTTSFKGRSIGRTHNGNP